MHDKRFMVGALALALALGGVFDGSALARGKQSSAKSGSKVCCACNGKTSRHTHRQVAKARTSRSGTTYAGRYTSTNVSAANMGTAADQVVCVPASVYSNMMNAASGGGGTVSTVSAPSYYTGDYYSAGVVPTNGMLGSYPSYGYYGPSNTGTYYTGDYDTGMGYYWPSYGGYYTGAYTTGLGAGYYGPRYGRYYTGDFYRRGFVTPYRGGRYFTGAYGTGFRGGVYSPGYGRTFTGAYNTSAMTPGNVGRNLTGRSMRGMAGVGLTPGVAGTMGGGFNRGMSGVGFRGR